MIHRIYKLLVTAYALLSKWSGPLVLSAVLLLVRVIWGYQFFLTGKGKLTNIERPIAFFQKLGIPAPTFHAWLVGIVECLGGAMLLAGFASRGVAFVLTINMTVAYLTADSEAVRKLFVDGEPGEFFTAAPFWFLLTSLVVLGLGPGKFSVDGLLNWSTGCHRQCDSDEGLLRAQQG